MPTRNKSRTYEIVWDWGFAETRSNFIDRVEATTAERAIAKVRRELKAEYADITNRDVIIHEARIIEGV